MPPLGYRYDPDERFIVKVTVDHQSGCFVWNACKGANGYGQFGLGGKYGPRATAHRWAYERYVETIPDGLVLDHLCRNPSCVNPDHLEPVTERENILRGTGASAKNAKKTHCPQGHPLDGISKRHGGQVRYCKACNRARARANALKSKSKVEA